LARRRQGHQDIIDGIRDGKIASVTDMLHYHIECHKLQHQTGDAKKDDAGDA